MHSISVRRGGREPLYLQRNFHFLASDPQILVFTHIRYLHIRSDIRLFLSAGEWITLLGCSATVYISGIFISQVYDPPLEWWGSSPSLSETDEDD